MAFDATLPANTTKIRNAPGILQGNWAAIVAGDTSFKPSIINLNQSGGAPANVASLYRLYSAAASGNTELFGINSNGSAVQLTKGGVNAIESGNSFLPGGLLIKWGVTAAETTSVITTGFTTLYNAQATVSGSPTDLWITVASPKFTIVRAASRTAYWFAIGV